MEVDLCVCVCVCVCSARVIRVDSVFVLCVNRLEK